MRCDVIVDQLALFKKKKKSRHIGKSFHAEAGSVLIVVRSSAAAHHIVTNSVTLFSKCKFLLVWTFWVAGSVCFFFLDFA